MDGKKLLIVDDDKEFLEELREALSLKGYYPIVINDSTTVLDVISTLKPDVILLDLNMDGMSGFRIAQSLKKSPLTSEIPIIAMTGVFTGENHFSLMDLCGIKICIEKPFNPQDLILLLKKVISKKGT
ncbi:MAG: two-component system response regulator [bacterium]